MPVTDFPRFPRRAFRGFACLLLFAAAVPGRAGQTRTWSQGEYADFEKGVIQNLSLRSDGLLTLAPRFREVFDSGTAYLWAVAQDSKGNLYTGGGPGAKLFRITPKGDKKPLAELDGLEIHAIAVDKEDRVYAATSPDGKVYRVAGGGKPEVFYTPKAKYIWALTFDAKGNLLVATGDPGQVHRVAPDGTGSVFFQPDETHVRSLTLDGNGNLILGTEPGGLVLRVSPDAKGFVLYQMSKKEVTAVAVAKDGSIYAAGVGNKGASGSSVPTLPPAQQPAAPTSGTGTPPPASRPGQPPSAAPPSVPGGSEVYRIDPSGTPRRVWNHPQEIVYSIGFDAEGRVLLGSGNKGNIYRIDSDTFYTALLNAPPNQITALYAAPNGHLFAASGNVGKVYEIGPGVEPEGWIESDVLDAGMYSLWGRLSFEAVLHGGSVTLTARSGNLDQPQKNWSSWTAPITSTKGARLTAPPARFLQWKAVLKAASAEQSPALESVDVAYLPKNLAPRVEEIEITPSNYKFPAQAVLPPPTPTLSLPPMRKRPQNSTTLSVSVDSSSTPSMQYAKGFLGTRWTASDENGDNLLFTVQIRGSNEKEWKPLKEKIRERYLSWDSTAFPDGEYRIRVIASDLPSNPPAEALEDSSESNPFVIDNTPPQITGLTATAASGKLNVRWKASDALNTIKRAEYSLDGGEWTIVAPTSLLSDSTEEDYDLTLSNVASGEHTIAVRVVDDYDNEGIGKAVVQ